MSKPLYDLRGKHVLVTGAAGGLGSALVRDLADRGVRPVVTSRSMKSLEEPALLLREATRTVSVRADLSARGWT
jgi:short-subunit dehydrogenase